MDDFFSFKNTTSVKVMWLLTALIEVLGNQTSIVLNLMATSRIKTVRAGERDCPQDNQALQASRNFPFETI